MCRAPSQVIVCLNFPICTMRIIMFSLLVKCLSSTDEKHYVAARYNYHYLATTACQLLTYITTTTAWMTTNSYQQHFFLLKKINGQKLDAELRLPDISCHFRMLSSATLRLLKPRKYSVKVNAHTTLTLPSLSNTPQHTCFYSAFSRLWTGATYTCPVHKLSLLPWRSTTSVKFDNCFTPFYNRLHMCTQDTI